MSGKSDLGEQHVHMEVTVYKPTPYNSPSELLNDVV